MMSVLDEIVAGVREDLALRQLETSIDDLKAIAEKRSKTIDPLPIFKQEGVAVIAEVKRSSPSKGKLADIKEPAELAKAYESGGAHCISVLTEERRFSGSLDDLVQVRKAVDLPILRKDFIVSSYQLWEARAFGADLILLIVAALEQDALVSLIERAESIGLTPLVEVHEEHEVARAMDAGAKIIGINNRNLKTLEVDSGTFAKLSPLITNGAIKIAESGISGPKDLMTFAAAGADAVLVGESLVRAKDPAVAVHELVTAGSHPSVKQGRI